MLITAILERALRDEIPQCQALMANVKWIRPGVLLKDGVKTPFIEMSSKDVPPVECGITPEQVEHSEPAELIEALYALNQRLEPGQWISVERLYPIVYSDVVHELRDYAWTNLKREETERLVRALQADLLQRVTD